MEAIPLVRARYAAAFAATLSELGVSFEPLLQRARLPIDLLEHQDGLISANSLWMFASDAAHATGIRDLGLRAGAMPVQAHGDFGTRVTHASSLHCAICAFCAEALAEYSEADLYLMREDDTAWFCRGSIAGTPDQIQQVELYVIALMVQTIRMATGPQWQPTKLQLQNDDVRGLADTELVRHADAAFGAPATRIGFPISALGMPLRYAPKSYIPSASLFALDNELNEAPTDFIESVSWLIASHIGRNPLSIRAVADIAGMSVRTLQRWLGKTGSSYSGLFEQTRYRAATRLLQDANVRITDVAFELGYSDVAHFTRAFKRMAGLCPSAYRRAQVG